LLKPLNAERIGLAILAGAGRKKKFGRSGVAAAILKRCLLKMLGGDR